MDIMLPVGVTIMFADNLDHSNHAGKTWVRTSVGRTPVGIDTTQTEFDTIGETGGAKTHTLTIAQMPQHTQIKKHMIFHLNKNNKRRVVRTPTINDIVCPLVILIVLKG